MSFRALFLALVFGTTLASVAAQAHLADKTQSDDLRAVKQRLEEGRAQGFTRLTALRFDVGILVNGSDDESASNWLASAVTIPLGGVGIRLVKQGGDEVVDAGLPFLGVIAQISCLADNARCDLVLQMLLSRDVQLPEDPSVKFRADVWQKTHGKCSARPDQRSHQGKEIIGSRCERSCSLLG